MSRKTINETKREITINMKQFEDDFELVMRSIEEEIAERNWIKAATSLGVMQAIMVYGGHRIQDRARYNSMVRIINKYGIGQEEINEINETDEDVTFCFIPSNKTANNDEVVKKPSLFDVDIFDL